MMLVRDSKPSDKSEIERMVALHAEHEGVVADPVFGRILVAEKRGKVIGMIAIQPALAGKSLISHRAVQVCEVTAVQVTDQVGRTELKRLSPLFHRQGDR